MFKNPIWEEATRCLFTSTTKGTNSGLPRNHASQRLERDWNPVSPDHDCQNCKLQVPRARYTLELTARPVGCRRYDNGPEHTFLFSWTLQSPWNVSINWRGAVNILNTCNEPKPYTFSYTIAKKKLLDFHFRLNFLLLSRLHVNVWSNEIVTCENKI